MRSWTLSPMARLRDWKWQHQQWSPEMLQKDIHYCATRNTLPLVEKRWSASEHAGYCYPVPAITMEAFISSPLLRSCLLKLHWRGSKYLQRVYTELQCRFQANRSTTDMVFSLWQLQEKCREKWQSLFRSHKGL